jgi:hypothetical protein
MGRELLLRAIEIRVARRDLYYRKPRSKGRREDASMAAEERRWCRCRTLSRVVEKLKSVFHVPLIRPISLKGGHGGGWRGSVDGEAGPGIMSNKSFSSISILMCGTVPK